jgi:4-amino-4-deoxy-L-arabinose transferase-like glycosyltransferase
MTSHRPILFASLTLLLFSLQFARSMYRDLDPDEHQFIAPPALLTQSHKLPYVDYPYFHTPDLVFIYAALTGWTSWKLLAARTISAICGTATAALLFSTGWRMLHPLPEKTKWILAGGITLIFINCRLFTYTSGWAWNHDSAVLCCLIAFLLHTHGMRRASIGSIIAAGFFAALAAGIRLSFAFIVVPLILSLLFGPSPLNRRQRILALLLAAVAATIAISPAIWLAAVAPQKFLFGNLGYAHLSTMYYATWDHHGMTFAGKIISTLEKFLTDPGNAFLLLAFVATLLTTRPTGEFRLLLGMLLALWLGVMAPTPIQQQYNYMLVPFMVLAIFYALATMTSAAALQRCVRTIAVAAIIISAISLPRWYWPVIYLPTPSHWKPVMQHRTAQWIAAQTGPGARVLTIESAVPLEAGLEIYPQYAVGRFIFLVQRFQSPDLRRKFDMVGPQELPALLADHPPAAVFSRIQALPQDQADEPLIDYAIQHHFRPITSPDGRYRLWLAP